MPMEILETEKCMPMVIWTDLNKQSTPKKSLLNIFRITESPSITKCRPRLCSYGGNHCDLLDMGVGYCKERVSTQMRKRWDPNLTSYHPMGTPLDKSQPYGHSQGPFNL